MHNHYLLSRLARDHLCDLLAARRTQRRFCWCLGASTGGLR
jgi:hypothetical protein